MNTTKDGGPTFPGLDYTPGYGRSRPVVLPSGETIWEEHSSGMSLRDYFAAKALQGMLSADCEDKMAAWSNSDKAAAWSYEFADAMLAEREKSAKAAAK
jgi:hypothetical protein